MACALDALNCAALSACAGGVLLIPAISHGSAAAWWLEVAVAIPLVLCAFGAPGTAVLAIGARHAVEWDEVDGKFVGVEDDTLLFDESGAWYDGSDLYDPREWEGEGGAGGVGREPYAAADRAAETKED